MNEEYKPITNLWKDSEGYRYFGTLKLSSEIKYDGDDFIPLWEWVKQLEQENKRQQKQFIVWLENYLKLFDNTDIDQQGDYDMVEEVLQKYKELIKDEVM